jgi:DNA-binding transcriptional LysR family regulator
MKLTNLNGWRAVEAVIRTGSLSEAAEELGVTRAAVAQRVRAVEDRLGRPLFSRTPGGLCPTDEAAAAAARLTEGFAAISGVQVELAGAGSGRRLALAVTQLFAETWLPRHLPDFFTTIPDADLRIDASMDLADLDGGAFDFAIRFQGEPDERTMAVDLLPGGVVPVCTPDLAESHGLAGPGHDLSRVPLVRLAVPTTDPEWPDWEDWSARTGIPLGTARKSVASYSRASSGVRLARSGMGLVLAGLADALCAVAEGDLVFPFGPESVVISRYRHRLIWRKGKRLSPVQRRFRDWISDRAAEDRTRMADVFGRPEIGRWS